MTRAAIEAGRLRAQTSGCAGVPGGAGGSADPIDQAHLSRYTLSDTRLEREILGLFLAQLPLTIESMRFSPTERDWQVAAHTLKGSCRAVGAWRLATLAQEAERIAATADIDAREAILDEIETAIAEVEAYVLEKFPVEMGPAA